MIKIINQVGVLFYETDHSIHIITNNIYFLYGC